MIAPLTDIVTMERVSVAKDGLEKTVLPKLAPMSVCREGSALTFRVFARVLGLVLIAHTSFVMLTAIQMDIATMDLVCVTQCLLESTARFPSVSITVLAMEYASTGPVGVNLETVAKIVVSKRAAMIVVATVGAMMENAHAIPSIAEKNAKYIKRT